MRDYTEIEAFVEKKIKHSRFVHSLGVVEVCEALAKRFSLETEKAKICGIYHDAYRYDGNEDSIAYLEERGVEIFPEERENPMLLHGALASVHFSSDLGEEVGDGMKKAVRHHTLGHREMGKLGAVLYIADYTEKGRKHLEERDRREIFSLPSLEEMVEAIIVRERIYHGSVGIKEAGVTGELYSFLSEGGKL